MATLGSAKLPPNNEVESIAEEVEKGFEDSNIIKKYLEKRIQIEEEYAKNLQKLCKSQPSLKKLGGISGAFSVIVDSTTQYSNHILQEVQKINDDINEPLKAFLKDLKNEQKTYITDGQNLAKERKEVFESLKNAKAKYDSLYEMDGDPAKIKEAEDEYKQQIIVANRYQASFHTEKLPKIQQDFQRLETIRMQRMKTNLKKFITEVDTIPSKLSTSIKTSEETINAIDTKKDIMAFVNFNKSLNQPWPDFTFEPCERKKKGWRTTMAALKIGSGGSGSGAGQSHKDLMASYVPGGQRSSPSNHPNAVFGIPISEVMEKQKGRYPDLNLPYILVLLINSIKMHGGMKAEGIFRIPGHNNDVANIKKRLNEGDYSVTESNVHTITSTLKAWMRDIPQPMIPDTLYEDSVNCESVSDLLLIFKQLPLHNQRIITYISQFLKELTLPENVQFSKMNIDNISMVFAPSLLRCNNPELFLSNIEKEKSFIRLLIESSQTLTDICPLQTGNIDAAIQPKNFDEEDAGPPPLAPVVQEQTTSPRPLPPRPKPSNSFLQSESAKNMFKPNSLGHHLQYPGATNSSSIAHSNPLPPIPQQQAPLVISHSNNSSFLRDLHSANQQNIPPNAVAKPPSKSGSGTLTRQPLSMDMFAKDSPTNTSSGSIPVPPPRSYLITSPDKSASQSSPPSSSSSSSSLSSSSSSFNSSITTSSNNYSPPLPSLPNSPPERERKFSIFSNLPPPPSVPYQ